jgi:hypothetical protein
LNGRNLGLAEKPKVEELQMDWLRSEDLKEEKNVTASMVIIAVEVVIYCSLSLPSGQVFADLKVGSKAGRWCGCVE